MKIKDAVTFSNAFWLAVTVCFASCLYYQYSQMVKYRPTVEAFVPKLTVTGVFAYLDFGKSLQGSRIDGHSVFIAANYAGGNHGFGNGDHIPNGSTVTARIAEIRTRSGVVWVPASIQSTNQQFVSRSPREMYDAWFSDSYVELASNTFFNTVFISTGLLVVCRIIAALIQYARKLMRPG
jgi:hypothetical protein